jgi:hypothetical protein
MSVINLIKNIDPQKKIFYNYYNIVSKNTSNDDINIQCSFEGKSNSPNIVYLNGSLRQNYISNNLKIFRNEMIIEHNPITNGGKKLYVSFPLVSDSRIDNTVIDYIIQTKYNDTIEIELNDIIIPEDKCKFYETLEYDIFIFSKPILVKTDLTNLPNSNFENPANYSIIRASQNNRHKEGFQGIEGFGAMDNISEQWMECDNVPVDFAHEIPSYNVPIQSKLQSEMSTIVQIFNLVKFFAIFVLILLFIYFVVPVFYKFLAFHSIFKLGSDDCSGRILGLDIFLSLMFIIIILSVFIYGYYLSDITTYIYYIYGSCLIIFYILSFLFIYISRKSDVNFIGFCSDANNIVLGNGINNIFRSPYMIIKSFE